MPGGIDLFSESINVTADYAYADAYLLRDHTSYLLKFEESKMHGGFAAIECKVYGTAKAAFALCIKDTTDEGLEASASSVPLPSFRS